MGIIWFFIFQFIFGVIGGCTSTYIQRSQGVAKGSTTIPDGILIIIVIASLTLSIWGTLSEKLPGTKKKQ